MTDYTEHGAIPVDDAAVGEFNDWSRTELQMEQADGGPWSATTELRSGRYRFRYLIDGERWENDWRADSYEPNEFGGDDSVIVVGSHEA